MPTVPLMVFLVMALGIEFVTAVKGWKFWTFLLLATVFTMRALLVGLGYVYAQPLVRCLDILLGVALFLWAVSFRIVLLGPAPDNEKRIGLAATLIALPVAGLTLAQILGPQSPQSSPSAVCDGTSVSGSRMKVRTGFAGLNTRVGPATTFAPSGKFDSNCVVGVDGYCVGEPINDASVGISDVRWLRLHHQRTYVAAGTTFALGPDSALGASPGPDCPGQTPEPSLAARPTVKRDASGLISVSARPVHTTIVGFAVRFDKTSIDQYENPGDAPKVRAADGNSYIRLDLAEYKKDVRAQSGSVTVAAVPCLRPITPAHSGEVLLTLNLATGESRTGPPLAKPEVDQIKYAACRINPSASNEQL